MRNGNLDFPDNEIEAYRNDAEFQRAIGLNPGPNFANDDTIRDWLLDASETDIYRTNQIDGLEYLRTTIEGEVQTRQEDWKTCEDFNK
jgi:hypothetical protein